MSVRVTGPENGTEGTESVQDRLREMIGEAPEGLPATAGGALIGAAGPVEREDGEPFYPPIIGAGRGFLDSYDHVINPYTGCSFGCSYCYASNFAGGPDGTEDGRVLEQQWGSWVKVKTAAQESMGRTQAGRLNGKRVYASSVTDPYQPVERYAGVWRSLLESIAERHPKIRLVVQTRSNLVARDTDIFQEIVRAGGSVQVNMTVGTDDERAVRHFEPGCQPVKARMKALASLSGAGVQTCATLTPMLPMQDAGELVRRIAGDGTVRFIMQPFHAPRDPNAHHVASTDREALRLLSEWYGTEPGKRTANRYNLDYLRQSKAVTEAVASMTKLEVTGEAAGSLKEPGKAVKTAPAAWLGTGKDGFKPPF